MFKNLWIEKYRPQKLDDIVLSNENRRFFEDIKNKQEIPHLLLFGIQGGGKSTLSKIVCNELLNCSYLYLNGSNENGIDTIRNKITNFIQTKAIDGKLKIVILDEADFLTCSAMASLRNLMEEYSSNCRFILTGNYINRIIEPIQSRCQRLELIPPLEGCVKRCIYIIKEENIKVDNDQRGRLSDLIKFNYPDMRSIIGNIQKYSINGVLNIPKDLHIVSSFAKDLFNDILTKTDLFEIRKHIIENEVTFNNDFHSLLKELFEVIYNNENPTLSSGQINKMMLIISEAMYKHQTVLDKEINCFAALIEISEIL